MTTAPTIGLILAAGAARRMGRPKQLLPWKATTLMGHAIQTLTQTEIKHCYVVVGAHAAAVRAEAERHGAKTLRHEGWTAGMGSSLRFGIDHLVDHLDPSAVLVMLADQPFLSTGFLASLFAQRRKKPDRLVATAYPDGRVGVPAVFGRQHLAALRQLEGDSGARQLLNAANSPVIRCAPPAPNSLVDLDTPEKYAYWRARG